jgi:hypothetical protein
MIETCPWCDEPVLANEDSARVPYIGPDGSGVSLWHLECSARMVAGGASHLREKCSCFGGTDPPDPPGLTRRQAARLCYEIMTGGPGCQTIH